MNNYTKYRGFRPIEAKGRRWPGNVITAAPIWCSVDLRDGNQALEIPMTVSQKLEYFKLLCDIGFKEIEISFPAASDTEFEFTRRLIEEDLIPGDVTVQVLTQSRPHLIERTFEALAGVRKAIVHFYNSTSVLQREVVFGKTRDEIIDIAVSAAALCKRLAEGYGRERFSFEYSPESFTGTELDYAVEICNNVLDELKPVSDNKVIINLPSTVEMSTPNIYADQVEYVIDRIKYREDVIVSLHAHNDRGTAVAATELAVLAGADRVEGTLFGNGERTGNADIMTVALNLYTQGIDPGLDFSRIDEIANIYSRSTRLQVGQRHPYAGELVYTAFSGSHQDAINKGMARAKEHPDYWEVPYLTIDPMDVGRNYDPVIRINSQSGKGGAAFVLEANFGIILPKFIQPHFGGVVKKASDMAARELLAQDVFDLFDGEYVNIETPLKLIGYSEKTDGQTTGIFKLKRNGEPVEVTGVGDGILEALCSSLHEAFGYDFDITGYHEHALEQGSRSRAITYTAIKNGDGTYYGAGISSSITKSSIRAIIGAVNKMLT